MLFYLAEEVKSERVSIGHVFCRSNLVCFESFFKKIGDSLLSYLLRE